MLVHILTATLESQTESIDETVQEKMPTKRQTQVRRLQTCTINNVFDGQTTPETYAVTDTFNPPPFQESFPAGVLDGGAIACYGHTTSTETVQPICTVWHNQQTITGSIYDETINIKLWPGDPGE